MVVSARKMIRKQVYLTAEQDTRLRRVARQQQRAEAELLRDALDSYLAVIAAHERVDGDALFRLVAIGRSEDGTLSESVDNILHGRGGA